MDNHDFFDEWCSARSEKGSGSTLDGMVCLGVNKGDNDVDVECKKDFVTKIVRGEEFEFRPTTARPAHWCRECGVCLCHPCFNSWAKRSQDVKEHSSGRTGGVNAVRRRRRAARTIGGGKERENWIKLLLFSKNKNKGRGFGGTE